MKKRIFAVVLSLMMLLTMVPATALAAEELAELGIYPYGVEMDDDTVTLKVDEGTSWQWQSATEEDGAYADIDGATTQSYEITPTYGNWYRCVVNGTSVTEAVQLIEPLQSYDVDGIEFTE